MGRDETKVDLIASTTHEFKTSLTAIITSAELLADELQMDKDSLPTRLVQNIIQNANNLDEKLTRFSKMSGLLAGDFPFQTEPVKIKPLIQSVTAQIYPIFQIKKQSLAVELPMPLPPVTADRRYLEQILLNLLTNANKFTPEGGEITLNARHQGRNLVVNVTDTGMGIPVEEQEKVFQPYSRVNKSSRGSGLGLAITKLLVELHGGTIGLKSTVGQGSTFFFSLPLAKI